MNINLKRRYPDSKTEDITDAFARGYSRGYEAGYDAGYNEATNHCFSGDCKQLRECLRAILDRGETPEDSGSKADRG